MGVWFFTKTKNCEIKKEKMTQKEKRDSAIGVLTIKRKNGVQDNHEVGVVAEMRDLALHRISLYLNSRNIRRLSDETIV